MSPEDPRHGTWAGYQRGCRKECCTTAARNYQKRRALDMQRGMPRTVSSLGAERRIRALWAIGWSNEAIGMHVGHSRAWVNRALSGNPRILRTTAIKIASAYDDLAGSPPNATSREQKIARARNINRARVEGWAPPSAWFGVDIDDPDAVPDPGWSEPTRTHLPTLIEDFDWLVSQGETEHAAAARIGVRLDNFRDSRRRHERAS